jgi:hypothetical protein
MGDKPSLTHPVGETWARLGLRRLHARTRVGPVDNQVHLASSTHITGRRLFKTSPQADWFNHVNVNAHDHGGHFIPW